MDSLLPVLIGGAVLAVAGIVIFLRVTRTKPAPVDPIAASTGANRTLTGTSATEDEALLWLEKNTHGWDLLIVDLFLKQGSGIHLAQCIAERKPNQKVVVFSNYVNASIRKRCAQLGVDAVFDKSTEIDSLVDYCSYQCFRVAQSHVQAA